MVFIKKVVITVSILASLWLIGFGVFTTLTLTRTPKDIDQTSDAIAVLTGGQKRINAGLELFASGRSPNLLITGINKNVTRDEILGFWEKDQALPACCITLDYDAQTTAQNANQTHDWVKENQLTSLRLVTGNYHMNRALMEFTHILPGVEIYPHPVKEPKLSPGTLKFWKLTLSEYHKTLIRSLQLTFTMRPEHLT